MHGELWKVREGVTARAKTDCFKMSEVRGSPGESKLGGMSV